jgi:Zn-dependent protease with chaperone function
MWTFVSLVVAAVPGVVAWWTGRRLLARRDDPALPERIVARANRLVQVTAASIVVLFFVSPHTPWIVALPLLGLFAGGFPTHKVLHEDRRGVVGYLLASARWWLAVLGVWTLLAFTPAIIAAAGPARWLVAALLGATLVAWDLVYVDVLRRVLGARSLSRDDLAPRFAAVVSRARAVAPRVWRFGFPGGRVVNAFALPSRRCPTVLFGDQLLQLLEPDEVAAIFAHEVAHLEHFDRKRLVQARVTMWALIGLTVVVAPLLGQWVVALSGYIETAWVVAVGLGLLLLGAARQQHEAESDRRAAESAWRLTLPDVRAARLMVSPATGAWTVMGTEAETEPVTVAAAGVVGRAEIRAKRWTPVESDESSMWAVTGPETAFEVRTRARGDWYTRWPLLPALFGGLPFDSEVWRRGPDGDRRVAGAPGIIQCMPPLGEGLVCLGYGTTARAVWVFREGSPTPEAPAMLPVSTWKAGLFQHRLVGLTSQNTVVVLDEAGPHGVQLKLAQESERLLDALVAGGRLIVLSGRAAGGAVSVYALP